MTHAHETAATDDDTQRLGVEDGAPSHQRPTTDRTGRTRTHP